MLVKAPPRYYNDKHMQFSHITISQAKGGHVPGDTECSHFAIINFCKIHLSAFLRSKEMLKQKHAQ